MTIREKFSFTYLQRDRPECPLLQRILSERGLVVI
jgi:hypothetical protein